LTGYAASSSSNFPTTPGAFQTTFGGGDWDAFVTKLNPAGSALLYSTYLGGSNSDGAGGIAVDTLGSAYVAGATESTDFPTTAGAFQTIYLGCSTPFACSNAFVSKLNPTGSALVYSTYLGGDYIDGGSGIAADSSGNANVAGETFSSNFPTTAGALQRSLAGGADAFFATLNPSGSALVYSTYLGGSGNDYGGGIALDTLGNAYVTGLTESSNFPTTAGALQTSLAGSGNAFVAKFENAPSAQVTNLQNTVKNLVSAGTLSPGLGQFLLAPLNAALAALGPGPATAALAASGNSHAAAAIRDLHEFIERVRLLTIFGALRRAEGRVLIDAANSLIAALRG
jgi:hypothetical protein